MANTRKSCYFAGYVGETKARLIALPIDDLIEEWPSTVPMLIGKRPGEQDTYLCDTVLHENELIWTVRLYDTQFKGSGSIQIVMVDQNEKIVGKSESMMTKVSPALTGKNDGQYDKEPEELQDPYLARLADTVEQVNTAITELKRINVTAEGYIQIIEKLLMMLKGLPVTLLSVNGTPLPISKLLQAMLLRLRIVRILPEEVLLLLVAMHSQQAHLQRTLLHLCKPACLQWRMPNSIVTKHRHSVKTLVM